MVLFTAFAAIIGSGGLRLHVRGIQQNGGYKRAHVHGDGHKYRYMRLLVFIGLRF